MTDCIRRPNSVWSSCTCEPCRADSRRKSKLHRAGHYRRIPSATAWEIIDRKRAAGWSSLAIASAAGIIHGTIQNALTEHERTGHRTHFGPTVSRKLTNIGDPTLGSVGVDGSRRRLRGLARQGYDLEVLAAITGIGFSTLAAIRSGNTTRVRAAFYTTIRDHVDQLGATVGPSSLAPKHAERKGWESLAAWDNIDTDEGPVMKCKFEGCAGISSRRGWCDSHYRRWQRCGDPAGTGKTGRPRGEEATYNAVHLRLMRARGKARDSYCNECGAVAGTWSYDHADPDYRIDDRGRPFSLDLDRYEPLCVPCHNRRDKAAKRERLAALPKDDLDQAVILRVMAGDKLPMTRAERVAVVAQLTAANWSQERIERHTGITRVDRLIQREAS